MTPSLAKTLLADRTPGVRILYGVATAVNTVQIAGSTVAVELPALAPVVDGDYVAVLAAGADRLILGAVGEEWVAFPGAAGVIAFGGSWQVPQYTVIGGRLLMRGMIGFSASFSADATLATLPAGRRPADNENHQCVAAVGGAGSARIVTYPDGRVTARSVALTGGDWVDLAGVQFDVTS